MRGTGALGKINGAVFQHQQQLAPFVGAKWDLFRRLKCDFIFVCAHLSNSGGEVASIPWCFSFTLRSTRDPPLASREFIVRHWRGILSSASLCTRLNTRRLLASLPPLLHTQRLRLFQSSTGTGYYVLVMTRQKQQQQTAAKVIHGRLSQTIITLRLMYKSTRSAVALTKTSQLVAGRNATHSTFQRMRH